MLLCAHIYFCLKKKIRKAQRRGNKSKDLLKAIQVGTMGYEKSWLCSPLPACPSQRDSSGQRWECTSVCLRGNVALENCWGGKDPARQGREPRTEQTSPSQKLYSAPCSGVYAALAALKTIPKTDKRHVPVHVYFGADGTAEAAWAVLPWAGGAAVLSLHTQTTDSGGIALAPASPRTLFLVTFF